MRKGIISLLTGLIILTSLSLRADEGMWLPLLLEKYNIEDMQKKGFRLSADDIYSINHSSMKDAVVIFGGGCTGELISDEGLLITNHHCGYSFIQQHSTLEHDYLTDGFWAMSKDEELINHGLKVRFLVTMKDVTTEILKGVEPGMTERERKSTIDLNISNLSQEYKKENNNNEISIKAFFHGNQYFMSVYKAYKDVRLVGAPPSSIGKFGGDTDNWMWPRHTGDFSLFRIYTAPDGSPAEYSEENIPMSPKKHFPISLKGLDKGDFTMVFGFPGSTDEYAPSYELELTTQTVNPVRIQIRDRILDKMKSAMETDKLIRIQYASKASGIANGWKKWIGINRGLERYHAIDKKHEEEKAFKAWAEGSEYENILDDYQQIYTKITPYEKIATCIFESLNGLELIKIASASRGLINLVNQEVSEERIENEIESLKRRSSGFFEDYNKQVAKAVTKEILDYYYQNVEQEYWPEIMHTIEKKGLDKTMDKMFKKSIIADEENMTDYLNGFKGKIKKLEHDPFYELYQDFIGIYLDKISPKTGQYNMKLDSLDRHYMAAQMEWKENKTFYPDANFTLRITYGHVDNYSPKNAVLYQYYTTIEGIMEKDDPEVYDYNVPEKLKTLYANKNYGQYTDDDGTMHVCFIANNHTSGGNSGSPVINKDGHLTGINFDRNWEGTMSDLMYDPDMCRNISLDIRYALFIIDKFAGAGYLVDEMTLIK
ncbi:MAG: S46 family peptidase [Bacteroidota bacterium]|nr:S46 family peptidase [Bacteroidota bacterium]